MNLKNNLVCVHKNCNKAQHARRVCKRHYDLLNKNPHTQPKTLREPQLGRKELAKLDYDDLWLWVKKELGLK